MKKYLKKCPKCGSKRIVNDGLKRFKCLKCGFVNLSEEVRLSEFYSEK